MIIKFMRPQEDTGHTEAKLTWEGDEGIVTDIAGGKTTLRRLLAVGASIQLSENDVAPPYPPRFVFVYDGVIYSKKNNKRIVVDNRTGRRRIISSKQALQSEVDMVRAFAEQWRIKKRQFGELPPPPYRLDIKIWEKNRIRRDLDNQATSIQDALVKAGILPDDDFKNVAELVVRFMGISKERPHAVVQISPAGN